MYIDTKKHEKNYVIELKECLTRNKYLKLESTSFNNDDGSQFTINSSKLYSNIPKGMAIILKKSWINKETSLKYHMS